MCLIGKTELYQYHLGLHLSADVHNTCFPTKRKKYPLCIEYSSVLMWLGEVYHKWKPENQEATEVISRM